MNTRFNPVPDHGLFDGEGVPCSVGESHGWYERIQACPENAALFLFLESEGDLRFQAATDYQVEAQRDAITATDRDLSLRAGRNHVLSAGQDMMQIAGRDMTLQVGRDCFVHAEQVRANAQVLVRDMDDGNTTWIEHHDDKTYFNLARFVRWVLTQDIDARLRALEGL